MKVFPRGIFPVLLLACLLTPVLGQQLDLASFEKRITVKKLDNGLTLVVMQRPEAPVFSFYTIVDAGSAQDPQGETGLAHMFEHMAFKGTTGIGSTDYPAEKAALAKVEETYAAYRAEKYKTVDRDDSKVQQLEQAWKQAIGRGPEIRHQEPVRRDYREQRRTRRQCLHQLGRNCLSLLAARQSRSALGLPGIGALPAPGDARVL